MSAFSIFKFIYLKFILNICLLVNTITNSYGFKKKSAPSISFQIVIDCVFEFNSYSTQAQIFIRKYDDFIINSYDFLCVALIKSYFITNSD